MTKATTKPVTKRDAMARTHRVIGLLTEKFGSQKIAVWRNGATVESLAELHGEDLARLDVGVLDGYIVGLNPFDHVPSLAQVVSSCRPSKLRSSVAKTADEVDDEEFVGGVARDDTHVRNAIEVLNAVLDEQVVSRRVDLVGWIGQRARLEQASSEVSGKPGLAWAYRTLARYANGEEVLRAILDTAMAAVGLSFTEFAVLRTLHQMSRRTVR